MNIVTGQGHKSKSASSKGCVSSVDPVRVGGQSTKTSRYSSEALLSRLGIALVFGETSRPWAYSPIRLGGGWTGFRSDSRDLLEKEIAHTRLTHLHVVDSMHERKALMASLADAFVLLPGGYGSWEEFCEVITWRNWASTAARVAC